MVLELHGESSFSALLEQYIGTVTKTLVRRSQYRDPAAKVQYRDPATEILISNAWFQGVCSSSVILAPVREECRS